MVRDGVALYPSSPSLHVKTSLCDLSVYFDALIFYQNPWWFPSINKELVPLHDDIKNRMRLFEFEEDAMTQLGTCGEKRAFVGSAEEIEDFIKFNSNRVSFVRGKEKFLSHGFVWRIPYTSGGFVQRRMSLLISSGIYSVWEKTFYAKTRDELDISLKKTIEVKQSLDTRLGALFKLIALAWSICITVFVIEILMSGNNGSMRVWLVIARMICLPHLRINKSFGRVRR
jgi:hypothetical protein